MFVQAPEVKKELGVKAEEFVKYDELMKEILRTGMSTPNVRKFCEIPQLNDKLKTLKDAFDDAEDYLNRFGFDVGYKAAQGMPRSSYLVNPLEILYTPTTSVIL